MTHNRLQPRVMAILYGIAILIGAVNGWYGTPETHAAADFTIPSASEKPTAKASRSRGVVIMTACEMPL